MARLPRVVVVNVAHHVTQRGNAQQAILSSDADRVTYLELLREYSQWYGLGLLGYCLMSNPVHLITVPHRPDGGSSRLPPRYSPHHCPRALFSPRDQTFVTGRASAHAQCYISQAREPCA
jgi:hypothetical protein